ncbi:MAG: hypothetical protein RIG77_12150 [Cyclobacteriaceae bacterium]
MKYLNIKYPTYCIILMLCFSCGPRVDLDLAKYGDSAFLLDARLFRLEQADRQIWEGDGTITGARRVFFSQGNAAIDNDNFTATISVNSADAAFISEAGLTFTHRAQKIEPINGSPIAGVPADLTDGSFTYRVHSADGSWRDWTVNIVTD